MDLLFKFGVLPSQNELKVIYPVGFSSPYNFTDLLQKYNEQRGGLQISSIYPNTPEEIDYTDLGISSSFTGVIVHIIHDSGVLGAIQDREISSLFDLGIVRIELEVTPQAYELPQQN